MKSNSLKQLNIKILLVFLCLVNILILSSCDNQEENKKFSIVEEKGSSVTCFGTLVCRENQFLSFPFDIHIQTIEAREGQLLSTEDILFYINLEELQSQLKVSANEVDSLTYLRKSYNNEIIILKDKLTISKLAVNEFDVNAILTILQEIANENNPMEKKKYALRLSEILKKYDILENYDKLINYTSLDDENYNTNISHLVTQIQLNFDDLKETMTLYDLLNYYSNLKRLQDYNGYPPENATVLLEKIYQAFNEQVIDLQVQIDNKLATVKKLDSDILNTKKKVDLITNLLSNNKYEDICYVKNSAIYYAKENWMVDEIYATPNRITAADKPIVSFLSMDKLEVSCFVEEQLIKDINIGDNVLLSLYADNTSIELGTVSFISQKAVIINGETMIEIIIDYDGDSFLPGYNIVAKISKE